MISFEQALRVIESSVNSPATEVIPLLDSLNRIIAQNVISDMDMPPFDKAAMDGYACRRADLGNKLSIVEEIPAGKVPSKSIGMNECARIMTGAMLPAGADYILMQEYAALEMAGCVKCIQQSEHTNICYKGEDIRLGAPVLSVGTRLLPAQIAILASVGCVRPLVYKRPRIAVLSTGNELVEPEENPDAGKIRNSNGVQLITQIKYFGLKADYLGIVRDDRQALFDVMQEAIGKYELILISGGVSVGDYDFVPEIIRELQMEIIIEGVNVKPGRHLLFSRRNNHFVAGMPGNPVSSFVLFEMFIKPFLGFLMGSREQPVWLSIPLVESYTRKNSDMHFFIPVRVTSEGTALQLEYHGSAHIHAYSLANGIMEIPVGLKNINKGEHVNVRPI